MTCRQQVRQSAAITDEMYAETERIRAAAELNNDIAMAQRAFNDGLTEIKGDMRQKILDRMIENEVDHITARQLFGLFN